MRRISRRMSPHVRRMMKGSCRLSPSSRHTELRHPWLRTVNPEQGWAARPCRAGYSPSMGCPHRKPNLRRIRSRRNPWEMRQKSSGGRGKSRPHNPRRSLATLPILAGRQCGGLLPLRHHRLPVIHIGRGSGPCLATSAQLSNISRSIMLCER